MRRLHVTVQEFDDQGVQVGVEQVDVNDHDFFLLNTGDCHVASQQVYPKSGTVVLTIKNVGRPAPKERT